MKKHLFLTGPSGCGKTTMIRSVLGDSLAYAGGFVTERVCSPEGAVLGFDLYPAAAAAGVEGFEPLRFMDYSRQPPVTNNEVFRVNAVQLLQEAQYYPFSLIDEFGGFELIIPQFRQALTEFLNSPQPCVGVLKGLDNAKQLRRSFGLGDRYSAYLDVLYRALEADEDTLLLQTSGRGDEAALKALRQWAEEYAHG